MGEGRLGLIASCGCLLLLPLPTLDYSPRGVGPLGAAAPLMLEPRRARLMSLSDRVVLIR